MGLINDLRHRLTVYNKKPMENDRSDTYYDYAEDGTIWGALTVMSGRTETLPGEAERADVTHKITIRPRSCKLTTATRFVYQGQRYDVLYGYPIYNRSGWMELYCRLVVEDRVQSV